MPVVIEYVVERAGSEKMIFSSKTEADAYDKLLDTADNIVELLNKSQLLKEEKQAEKLALFLAKNRDNLIAALAQKRKPATKVPEKPTKNSKSKKAELSPQSLLDITIEPDEEAMQVVSEDMMDQSHDDEAAA